MTPLRREAFLAYLPNGSLLHGIDARTKLGALGLIAATTMIASTAGLVVILGIDLISLLVSRLPLGRLTRESKGVWILALVIVIASTLSASEPLAGLSAGLIYSARLLLLVVPSQVLLATTSFEELRIGIARLFRLLPARVSWTVGVMVSLAIAFVPTPLAVAEEIRIAATSRGLRPSRRPFRYLRLFVMTMVVRTLLEAESRRLAVELRCPLRPPSHAPMGSSGWFLLAFSFFLCGVAAVV